MMFAENYAGSQFASVCKTCRVLAVYFVKGVHQTFQKKCVCVCVIMYSTALVDMLQRNGHESFVCPSIRMH